MQWNHTAPLTAPKHHMTTPLPLSLEPEPLQCPDKFSAGENRQLWHQAAMSKVVTIGAPPVCSGNSSR